MRDVLLVRFAEVHLKGQNRPFFLKKLTGNVRKMLNSAAETVWLADSRIYAAGIADMSAAAKRAAKVFGVHSVSPALEMDKDYDAISAQAIKMTSALKGSFKVMARRSDKKFPMDSMALQRALGETILINNPNLTVDVKTPEHRVCVEIRDMAYLYVDEIDAVGGLPMGTGGKAALLLSGGIDSPVAGFSLMRRGVQVNAVHFFSFPYTGERAKEKVLELARILAEYQSGMKVFVVPFTEIQMEIHEKCPDDLGTVLMRRYMMRIAERIAVMDGGMALITGESLGQVASQTMEALAATDSVVSMPVFRPLIGQDKLEITKTAVSIGTYETSILPYEDCCTVFTPRHPATKPKPSALTDAESLLETEDLITRAMDSVEIIVIP